MNQKSSREIKFRAWDEDNKEIWYPETIGRGYTTSSDNLMQFTGLLDRHGTEIYEGDIVITDEGVGKVKFENCCFAVWDDYEVLRDSSAGHDRGVEVIGNIYEHPHLLKSKEQE